MKILTKTTISFLLILLISSNIDSFAKNKVRTEIDSISAIQNIIFDTAAGKIIVSIPEDILAGDMISGTITKEPKGKNESDMMDNLSKLDKYSVEINNETTVVSERDIKFNIPKSSTGGVTYMILRGASGDEWARNYITYQNSSLNIKSYEAPSPWEYQSPKIGRSSNPSVIKGPFDGNFGTTSIVIGNTSVKKIAESPRVLVFENPSNPIGNIDLVLNERGVNVKRKYSNIKVVKVDENGSSELTATGIMETDKNKQITKEAETPIEQDDSVVKVNTDRKGDTSAMNEIVSENERGFLKESSIPIESGNEIINAKADPQSKEENTNNAAGIDNNPKSSSTQSGKYTVQIASYKQQEDAMKLAKRLQSKGYEAYIIQAKVPSKGTWHRVRIGSYPTKTEAKNYGSHLAKNEPLIDSMFVTLNN
ncbi:MAG TPA: SPOR domain-containing protein [Thermodesulfobacteriota bacterium]|nr:SPOR domain-containing protein [Thermodesulfobacteriota bacterium]